MLDIKSLNKAIEHIAAERDIDPEKIKEAVEAALASAYKKEFGRKGEMIRASLDDGTGEVKFYQVKIVVDEGSVRITEEEGADADEEPLPLYNEQRHIFIEDAKKIKEDVNVGDELIFDLPNPPEEFGRISAQTAKQVILQRIREIEKEIVRNEFQDKIGELVSGTVQRIERGNVYVDLGKASGVMYFSESVPGEHYRIGERLRFYLLDVKDAGKTPTLLLSRTHPKFVSKLFELEVPEIADGIVVIKSITREAGSRTKIAVHSTIDGVDPVGACVGQRGARVMAVNSELFNERIDIIEWSEDPAEYVASALSPAMVSSVEIIPPNTALVLVPEDNLSLAIGKGGQNVRLAARLTGWRIDVRSQSNPDQVQEGGISDAIVEDEENEESLTGNMSTNSNIFEEKEGDRSGIGIEEDSLKEEDDEEINEVPGEKNEGGNENNSEDYSGNENDSENGGEDNEKEYNEETKNKK